MLPNIAVISLSCLICLAAGFSACKPAATATAVAETETANAVLVAKRKAPAADTKERVDVDLTRLSSTMVYGEVFNMLIDPESYEGKSVRMKGLFYVYEYDGSRTGERTYACVIQDATACCAQGLAFTLSGKHSYPQDYPELYSTITVRGRFHQYEKDGLTYTELVDGVLEE